jgi:hypothetical protein
MEHLQKKFTTNFSSSLRLLKIAIFCLVLGLQVQAQTVNWGTSIEEKNAYISNIIQTDKGVFTVYPYVRGGLFSASLKPKIHRYNQNLTFERELQFDTKDIVYQTVRELNNDLYWITEKEGEEKDRSIYAQKINQESMKLEGQQILLETLKDKKRDKADFSFLSSKDRKKMAVIGFPGIEKDANEQFAMTVFDENMKKIWSKDIELPYSAKLFQLIDYQIDVEGNFYVLGKLYVDKVKEKRKGEDESNYSFLMLVYKGDTEKPEQYNIALDGLFIGDLGFQLDVNKNILCTGFYHQEYKQGYKGVFFLKIDTNKKAIVVRSTKEFTKELVEDVAGKKAARKDRGISSTFEIREFVPRSDGGLVALVESYFSYAVTTYTYNGAMVTTYHYVGNEILAININPDGTIEWLTVIEKKQHTTNDNGYYLSFADAVVNDKIYLLFNVNEKQYTKKNEMVFSNPQGFFSSNTSFLLATELQGDGKASSKVLFANKKEDIETIAVPKLARQVQKNELLMMTARRKEQRLVRVTFTE